MAEKGKNFADTLRVAIAGGAKGKKSEEDESEKILYSNQIQTLDSFRMLGVLVFTTDLGLKFAYLFKSRFVSQFIYNLFLFFVWARGVFIVVFHVYRLCMDLHRMIHDTRKKQSESQKA